MTTERIAEVLVKLLEQQYDVKIEYTLVPKEEEQITNDDSLNNEK